MDSVTQTQNLADCTKYFSNIFALIKCSILVLLYIIITYCLWYYSWSPSLKFILRITPGIIIYNVLLTVTVQSKNSLITFFKTG